jgi:hypothetical protein
MMSHTGPLHGQRHSCNDGGLGRFDQHRSTSLGDFARAFRPVIPHSGEHDRDRFIAEYARRGAEKLIDRRNVVRASIRIHDAYRRAAV